MFMKVHQELIDPSWRANPPHDWGAYEICYSAVSIALCLLFIAGLAVGVLELIGFNSLSQIYGYLQG